MGKKVSCSSGVVAEVKTMIDNNFADVGTLLRSRKKIDASSLGNTLKEKLKQLTLEKGVVVLNGASGTGKTIAAQVIAGKLNAGILRIDSVDSLRKYIGETEKNIDQLLGGAKHKNLILFFDEADALFGKRTTVKDSHDRYANQEVSYLLHKLEAYGGLTILSTNLKGDAVRRLAGRFTVISQDDDD